MKAIKSILIVPTLNAGDKWNHWISEFKNQTFQPDSVLVIDSQSEDDTLLLSQRAGFYVHSIARENFNHGGTRQAGIDMMSDVDIVIFLTQDAIFASNMTLKTIVDCFHDKQIGAAYGRQLPNLNEGAISAHARIFNYPNYGMSKSFDDKKLGIKTAFISNSFAVYRREALMAIGGFPNHTILSEDTYVAAKMLLRGWKIQYCAEAQVYHSHDYNFIQEFKRYFDIGVFHAREPWIREKFGKAEGEGLKFVISETKHLLENGKGYLLPSAFIRTCLKYLGYRLGTSEDKIPLAIKKQLSMHRLYWDQ